MKTIAYISYNITTKLFQLFLFFICKLAGQMFASQTSPKKSNIKSYKFLTFFYYIADVCSHMLEDDRFCFWNSRTFILRMTKSSRKWSGKIQKEHSMLLRNPLLYSQDKRAKISKRIIRHSLLENLFLKDSWSVYLHDSTFRA